MDKSFEDIAGKALPGHITEGELSALQAMGDAIIESIDKKVKDIDPDLSPESYENRERANKQGLTYDKKDMVYRDKEGSMVRDRFGQPL